MPSFDFALVVVFWASLILAMVSIFTPNAAFLCRKHTRIRGLASWLGVAVVAGALNMGLSGTNTLF